MTVFSKIKELILGKPDLKRDELCSILQKYGMEARNEKE
jgi:hypothetical protein